VKVRYSLTATNKTPRLNAGILVALAGLATGWRQGSEHRVHILFASDYFPGQISATTGEKWFGLYPGNGQWELAVTTIRVQPVNAGCIHDGRRVSVDRNEHSLFLVRGLSTFRAGPVLTASESDFALEPNAVKGFRIAERAYRFTASGDSINYELRLVRVADGRSQQIVTYHAQRPTTRIVVPPHIIWIGDLDRDGQPDFFADIHMFETPGHWVLYLSSQAGSGELLHRVAEFQGEDC
jgi:hypothetical protein